MTTGHLFTTVLFLSIGLLPAAEESTLINPTTRRYEDELVRLNAPAPGPAGSFVVMREGQEVPYQTEKMDSRDQIWIRDTFEPGATHSYRVAEGRPVQGERALPSAAMVGRSWS